MRIRNHLFALSLAVGGLSIAAAAVATAADKPAKGGSVWAQLSSKVTQRPTSTAPMLVNLESNDGANGLGYDAAKPSEITVKTPGVYMVIAAGQTGKTSGSTVDYVDLWLRKNGKDVDNSNTRKSVAEINGTAVLLSQGLLELKTGDVISVAMSVSAADHGLGLTATTPKGEPVIPALIFSIYKVN